MNTSTFYEDLKGAKGAEHLVFNVLSSLDKERTYEYVGDNRDYYYKGDIKATEKSGKEIFIEVKNDSRIAETQRVLCEEGNYFKRVDYYKDGGMYNKTDIYCVVSESERKIYIMDFKVLQKHYQSGQYMELDHPVEVTYCFLLELCRIKQFGGLIAILDY